jgi:anti-sigma-K factor RskA
VNIQEYISSGIIESYVLGLASAEERIEFEQLCSQYPELIEVRKQFEEAIEKQAMENAPAPPAFLKEKIWSEIQQSSSKIINMESTTRSNSGLSWVAAASIILFLAAGYFAYKFYNEKKDIQAQLVKTESDLTKLIDEQNAMVVNLVSMPKAQPSSASIYWDSTSSNVYMIVKNMPKLANDKQYQLWALIDNKPSNLGLFDGGEKIILKMNGTKKADAFAITIENKGNTGGPNLEQLQSMGKTKTQ